MFGIVFLLIYVCLGLLFANIYLSEARPFTRVWAGSTAGIIFLMCSHVPFSFFMDFTILSHLLGLLLTSVLVLVAWFFKNSSLQRSALPEKSSGLQLLLGKWKVPFVKGEIICLAFVIPMTVSKLTLFIFTCLLSYLWAIFSKSVKAKLQTPKFEKFER